MEDRKPAGWADEPTGGKTLRSAAERPNVSVLVPLKDEAPTLGPLYDQIRAVMEREGLAFEILFLDDGSTDDSPQVLRRLAGKDPRVRVFNLRRNFGKAAALSIGFTEARGAAIVTIDADLQDDPQEIPRLLVQLRNGYDLASGWKQKRRDRFSRRFASRVFNWMTRKLSGMNLHDFNCGLKAYSTECARELAPALRGELHRYLPVLAHARGFRVTEVRVRHRKRENGRSRYGMERYTRGLLDLLTATFLTKYSLRPMHIFGGVGLILFVPGAIALGYLVVIRLAGQPIGGRPLLVLAGVLCITGLQLLLFGMLAEMLATTRNADVPYTRVVVLDDTDAEEETQVAHLHES